MTIKTIDRTVAKAMMKAVEAELAKLMKSYGVNTKFSGRFDSARLTMKIEMMVPQKDSKGAMVEQVCLDYDSVQKYTPGLPLRGTKINYLGDEYEVYGWKARARKTPVLMKSMKNGKLYKASIHNVMSALASMDLMKKAAKR